MKDAYSLDRDEAGLDVQYARLHDAYVRIFERCGLPAIAVGADLGMMGGSEAQEFMYLSPLGEDTLVLCDSCGYAQNRQVATAARVAPAAEDLAPLEQVETPGTTTIETLAALLGIGAERTAKVVFLAATATAATSSSTTSAGGAESGPEPVAFVVAVVRGDTTVNETKLANVLGASELRPMSVEEIAAIGCVPGYASPIGVGDRATVVVDDLVVASPNLVAGANVEGAHLLHVNVGRDYTADVVADITAAGDGDPCVVCGSALRTSRGIEVGNIFKLGTKYSVAAGATFLDDDGSEKPVVMGSYGIGVGRLMACIAEEHHDGAGIVWPASVAPFAVHLCAIGDEALADGGQLYAELEAAGVDVLFDDRGERAGVQFADADLIGVPLRLVVSPRAAAAGGVEAKRRAGGDAVVVPRAEVVSWVRGALATALS
jgi:prolyl-tRNA synthetase